MSIAKRHWDAGHPDARRPSGTSLPSKCPSAGHLMTYAEKLRDPRWQRRRLEKLDAADFHCESCGDGESTLHVHHRFTNAGANRGTMA